MNSLTVKIVRGSNSRRSRLHDEKGNLALHSPVDLVDMSFALGTAVLKVSTGWRPKRPFIAMSALRFIRSRLSPAAKIFEWGCGMSTLWYEAHYGEVHGVEHDPNWYARVSSRTRSAHLYLLKDQEYTDKILDFPPEAFDLIVVDGLRRLRCFELAPERLKPGGILIVDDTDKGHRTHGEAFMIDRCLETDSRWNIHRFTGWTHGNFFPQETTVMIKRS